ncbi:MAG: hypothetical protein JWP76_4497 [Dactylosporangium sp.]|nr:hypothetical protein [Dactylosporangium sp.]
MQAGGGGEHLSHRQIGAGDGEEGAQVVVEAEPPTYRPLHSGHFARLERTPRVHGQVHPRLVVRRGCDLDHHGLVRMGARPQ